MVILYFFNLFQALAVDPTTGDIYLFTKDREESISEVYRYTVYSINFIT